MKPIPIITMKGKIVARILADATGRIFSFKSIDQSKHMLRLPPAFAYDRFVLEQAEAHKVEYHVIQDKLTKRCWSAWPDDIEVYGFTFDRGYGEQVALELKYWSEGREPQRPQVIELFAKDQGDLFEEEAA